MATTAADVTFYNDEAVEESKLYTYSIRAFNNNGPSSSVEVSSNAPPAVTNFDNSPTYIQGNQAITIDNSITVTDADMTNQLTAATVKITNLQDGADEMLDASPSGAIVVSDIVYDSLSGELTITRSASITDYLAVLQSATYINTSSTPNEIVRSIELRVNDGIDRSLPQSILLAVDANDPSDTTPPALDINLPL